MNFKKLAFGLTLAAAFGFVACGDDDESSPVGPSNDPAVSSSSVKASGDSNSSDSNSSTTSSESKSTAKSSDSKSSATSSDSKASAKSSGSLNSLIGDYGQE